MVCISISFCFSIVNLMAIFLWFLFLKVGVVRGPCCSCRGLVLSSQHSGKGGLQSLVTLVLGDPIPSSGLHGHSNIHIQVYQIWKMINFIKLPSSGSVLSSLCDISGG